MKTTNFEISKQLAEAGFKRETEFGYDKSGQIDYPICNNSLIHIKCYDLETILEALPNFIENVTGTGNCLVIDVAFGEIHYEGDSDNDAMFITTTEENESLADAAAKLWLKLKKEGLV